MYCNVSQKVYVTEADSVLLSGQRLNAAKSYYAMRYINNNLFKSLKKNQNKKTK